MRNSSAAFSVSEANPVKCYSSQADYCGKCRAFLRRNFGRPSHILASQTFSGGGDGMLIYGVLIGMVSFAVNFLLLLGTNRLLGATSRLRSIGAGAILGALHSVLCAVTGFRLFSGFFWNVLFLLISGMVAFGFSRQCLGKCVLYSILSMALSWLTAGTGGGIWIGLAGAIGIFFLCVGLVGHKTEANNLMPVELNYKNEKVCVWALRDTGNSLNDPISGNPVLVVGPKVAEKLVGLTQDQLENPVESVGDLPGLRLIPYHTVGLNKGLLLGMRLQNIKIGKWQGSSIVAFAPCGLGERQTYQALTGGNL